MKKTLTDLLIQKYQKEIPDKEIFFTKSGNEYISENLSQLLRKIYFLIKYFENNNCRANDKVAIISENCIEWVVTDFAAMFMNMISIPVYTSLSKSQIAFILINSETKICFVSNINLYESVYSIRKDLTDLKEVILYKENKKAAATESGSITLFSEIIKDDNKITDEEILRYLKKLSGNISENDLLTIIYTSGTTGIPKGVMLSHLNIYSNIKACQQILTINENDTFLSYLPYSHAYERTAGYYLPLFSGAKIYYAQNIETIAAQFPEARPTIVITVPRLLEKIYNRLISSSEDMKEGIQTKIFLWAMKLAGEKSINKKSIKWKIADKIVFTKIRLKTGGNIRFFASGGGALNITIGMFFENIGITIIEGYGMTETSPVISVNAPDKNKYGTVGRSLDGVSVKLSHENEILVSGESLMLGYYKDENSTKEVIRDNWLHTGDIGEIDLDGYIKITDRKKSLMKTSGGKYVSPTQIEELILKLRYIENAVVLGNERMYISALLVPVKNELIKIAEKNEISFSSYPELIKDKKILKLVQKDIDELQKDLSTYEKVRKITLLENVFSIEDGELTPTLKIKRKFVEEKYKDEIEIMYPKM